MEQELATGQIRKSLISNLKLFKSAKHEHI